jgi:phosphoribosyl-ATP pyrophosphohydrolase
VGGGIRSVDEARRWLDAGARKVILGTAATPEVLGQLPRQRVMAAVDGVNGELVVEGWQRRTGEGVCERLRQLRDMVGGFLVTFVEREGRLRGIDRDAVDAVLDAAGETPVTVAGGVSTADEVAALDHHGADAQVGMALYTGALSLADAMAAPLRSDRPDGLWPTVVVDDHGSALGLAYSSLDSLREAVSTRRGVYHSRSRGRWVKGETSGNAQELLRVDVDCDRDSLRFAVRQLGVGFCHRSSWTCWGAGAGLGALERRVRHRLESAPQGSYTARLVAEPALLGRKLEEEARELAEAKDRDEAVWEAADLVYFATVAVASRGASMAEVLAELDRRGLAVRRRDGSVVQEVSRE